MRVNYICIKVNFFLFKHSDRKILLNAIHRSAGLHFLKVEKLDACFSYVQVVQVIVKIVTPCFNRPSLSSQVPIGIVYNEMKCTVWCKCLTRENFDEFDELKLHHQNFPSQYVIFRAYTRVLTDHEKPALS